MNNANYILKTNEAVLMPTEVNKGKSIMKICVWVIIGIIILGSFIFQDNLFAELSWPVRIFMIVLAVGFGFYGGKKEYTASPMELQFYDDRLVLYLPKRYYSNRVTRKQINTMRYADISKCVYKTKSNRIHIYGDGQSVWYNYKKDGSLPSKPTEERSFTQGLIYFNTQLATDVDFKKEIEEHSPIQVIVENN
jgi:hypothetical protein